MDIYSILSMLGGLALFLYGMHMLSDGLKKASGSNLENILEKLTNNKIKGVLLGALVTAVIQSSSATTVMVVGFVNSGIMSLTNAVGVIFGANIGTTLTAWILSTSQISGDSLILNLLKPSSFAPVVALIGVVMATSKKENRKNIGSILAGFGILMLGMEMMSGAVEPLADDPAFAEILLTFSNPVIGLLTGVVLTAIIQSSSATIGILQAFSSTGAILWSTGMPIVLGSNVGSVFTALLSSSGANRNGKRSALVHLFFNIFASLGFMIVFYALNYFVHFAFLNESINAIGIAILNTLVNSAAVIILLPLSDLLVKLAYKIVPETAEEREQIESKEKQKIKILDERFLTTPKFAIAQARTVVNDMANLSREALFIAIDLLLNYDAKKVQKVVDLENLVDYYDDEIGTYLVKLASQHLTEEDSQELTVLTHSIGDFERISDHAINIADCASEINDKGLSFSLEALDDLAVYTQAINDVVNKTMDVFLNLNVKEARVVEPMEEMIDYLSVEVKRHHMKRLQKGKCDIRMSFVFADLCTNYERISDHCSNIALSVLAIDADNYETHEVQIGLSEDQYFNETVNELKNRYQLPDYRIREAQVVKQQQEEANK